MGKMLFGMFDKFAKRVCKMGVVKRDEQVVTLFVVSIQLGAVKAKHLSLLFETV